MHAGEGLILVLNFIMVFILIVVTLFVPNRVRHSVLALFHRLVKMLQNRKDRTHQFLD